jgi:ribulose-bisphosphate carboxylase small chain
MKTLPKERRYETLSYLPPLTDAQIERQIAYILKMGYSLQWNSMRLQPRGLLLDHVEAAFVQRHRAPQEVLSEVQACRSEYPTATSVWWALTT